MYRSLGIICTVVKGLCTVFYELCIVIQKLFTVVQLLCTVGNLGVIMVIMCFANIKYVNFSIIFISYKYFVNNI